MTGVKRQGSVPEISSAWGFPFSYASQVATKTAFTGSASAGATLDAQGTYLAVASEACYVKFGASNVAASTSSFHYYLPAGVPFIWSLPYSNDVDTVYFSVIQDTAAGFLVLTQQAAV